MLQLRPYQTECARAISEAVQRKKNPVAVIPTGGGKSLVIAYVCARIAAAGKRVLLLTHVKELVEGNFEELMRLSPFIDAGIYSAGLSRKDAGHAAISAGVQSYVRQAYNEDAFDYIIIDEAHRVPPDGEGQYRKIIDAETAKNPKIRVIGLTATPYRQSQGLLTEGDGALFDEICYQADFLDMVRDGYLAPVTSYHGLGSADMRGVHTRRGEFLEAEAEAAFMAVLPEQVAAIIKAGEKRKKWLIFATSIRHAEALHFALNDALGGERIGLVHGEIERDPVIEAFKADKILGIVNVNILTTGFNVPSVDMLALCRATQSTSLYVQMVGRGTRIAPGKTDCLVLDFGGNVARHGPIDLATQAKGGGGGGDKKELAKTCKACGALNHLAVKECEVCGELFPIKPREIGKNLESKAANGGIVSTEATRIYCDSVNFVADVTGEKSKTPGQPVIIMEFIQNGEYWPVHRQWLMLWHDNDFARSKSWTMLNAVTGGKAHLLRENITGEPIEQSEKYAAALNAAYAAGKFQRIDFVLLLPNKKNPKYHDLVSWGMQDLDADESGQQEAA
jgi:DNA repair protein RadD